MRNALIPFVVVALALGTACEPAVETPAPTAVAPVASEAPPPVATDAAPPITPAVSPPARVEVPDWSADDIDAMSLDELRAALMKLAHLRREARQVGDEEAAVKLREQWLLIKTELSEHGSPIAPAPGPIEVPVRTAAEIDAMSIEEAMDALMDLAPHKSRAEEAGDEAALAIIEQQSALILKRLRRDK
jgi:hypothetical protein